MDEFIVTIEYYQKDRLKISTEFTDPTDSYDELN